MKTIIKYTDDFKNKVLDEMEFVELFTKVVIRDVL